MTSLTPSMALILALALVACSPGSHATQIARFDDGPFAGKGFPYSQSARVGNLLFLAGQIGEDRDGNLVPGGIQREAEKMMVNIEAALARRGLAMKDVVKCTVFLADIGEWGSCQALSLPQADTPSIWSTLNRASGPSQIIPDSAVEK